MDERDRAAMLSTDSDLPIEVVSLFRVTISTSATDAIEIFAHATDTTLTLPLRDVDLLIDALRNLDRTALSLETVDLDPFL